MQSDGGNRNVLIHYWCDFSPISIEFTVSQALLVSHLPGATLIHTAIPIKKGDLREQAIILKQFMNKFPENTIHICHLRRVSVDSPRYVITRFQEQYFLGPATGFMHLAFEDSELPYYILPPCEKDQDVLQLVYLKHINTLLSNPKAELKDLFARKEHLPKPQWLQPIVKGDRLRLVCLYVDADGNCFLNINRAEFEVHRKGRKVLIRTQMFNIQGIHNDYNDLPEGKILALFGHGDLLQLSQNNGNCSRHMGIYVDTAIIVEFYE